jgi:hypothetical protein
MLPMRTTNRSTRRNHVLSTIILLPLLATVLQLPGISSAQTSESEEVGLRYDVNMTEASPITRIVPQDDISEEDKVSVMAHLSSQLLYTVGLYRLQNATLTEASEDGWVAPRDPYVIESTPELVHAIHNSFLQAYATEPFDGEVTECFAVGGTALFTTWYRQTLDETDTTPTGQMTVRVQCVDGPTLGVDVNEINVLLGTPNPQENEDEAKDVFGDENIEAVIKDAFGDVTSDNIQLLPVFKGESIEKDKVFDSDGKLLENVQIIDHHTVRLEDGSIFNFDLNQFNQEQKDNEGEEGDNEEEDSEEEETIQAPIGTIVGEHYIVFPNGTVMSDIEHLDDGKIKLPHGQIISLPEEIAQVESEQVHEGMNHISDGTVVEDDFILLPNGTLISGIKHLEDGTIQLPDGQILDPNSTPTDDTEQVESEQASESTSDTDEEQETESTTDTDETEAQLPLLLSSSDDTNATHTILFPNGTIVDQVELLDNSTVRLPSGETVQIRQDEHNDEEDHESLLLTSVVLLSNNSLLLDNGTVVDDAELFDNQTARLPTGEFVHVTPAEEDTSDEIAQAAGVSAMKAFVTDTFKSKIQAASANVDTDEPITFLGAKIYRNGTVRLPNGTWIDKVPSTATATALADSELDVDTTNTVPLPGAD